MIEESLQRFARLIRFNKIIVNRSDNHISEYKARLILKDDSILEFTEIQVWHLRKRKYSYQWMTSDFDLIVRWDNASHHPHISTYPHHKHVHEELNIEPSEEMFLPVVLAYIDTLINK